MKELIRRIVFPFVSSEIAAREGTLKYHFLSWLYGNGESYSDGWVYPEDSNAE